MPFDFKKEYKEFYLPKNKTEIVTIPPMNFVAVRGKGDPNETDGEYQTAIGLLYGIAYTIKMSGRSGHELDGFFDYVVPPLEGFWWMDGVAGMDYSRKADLHWISVIRLPDFVKQSDFDWAVAEATRKKKLNFSKAEFFAYDKGLCVQCMHLGSFDDERPTVDSMEAYAKEQGYANDITDKRFHHEIYISDFRRTAPDKLKTVIRHPVKKVK